MLTFKATLQSMQIQMQDYERINKNKTAFFSVCKGSVPVPSQRTS